MSALGRWRSRQRNAKISLSAQAIGNIAFMRAGWASLGVAEFHWLRLQPSGISRAQKALRARTRKQAVNKKARNATATNEFALTASPFKRRLASKSTTLPATAAARYDTRGVQSFRTNSGSFWHADCSVTGMSDENYSLVLLQIICLLMFSCGVVALTLHPEWFSAPNKTATSQNSLQSAAPRRAPHV